MEKLKVPNSNISSCWCLFASTSNNGHVMASQLLLSMDEHGPTTRVLLDVEDDEQRQARIRRLGSIRNILVPKANDVFHLRILP